MAEEETTSNLFSTWRSVIGWFAEPAATTLLCLDCDILHITFVIHLN